MVMSSFQGWLCLSALPGRGKLNDDLCTLDKIQVKTTSKMLIIRGHFLLHRICSLEFLPG